MKTTKKAKIKVTLVTLGNPRKLVEVEKGTTYNQLRRKLRLNNYLLFVNKSRVEDEGLVKAGVVVSALPNLKGN